MESSPFISLCWHPHRLQEDLPNYCFRCISPHPPCSQTFLFFHPNTFLKGHSSQESRLPHICHYSENQIPGSTVSLSSSLLANCFSHTCQPRVTHRSRRGGILVQLLPWFGQACPERRNMAFLLPHNSAHNSCSRDDPNCALSISLLLSSD
ncbi:hypothetical protein HPG69_004192 [Diceros bicornis minor]|uniref:Uncharacterized protein n=1 Tax=Diceros bicornis minor TaxID=77932 RepID=A0A7J7EA41_DICBM|nr:hypothetical protein HPG69_004192 [Diceros bicornis minor]